MKRLTKKPQGNDDNGKLSIKDKAIGMYSALVSRAGWMARLGLQYGGDRDLYQAFGYITDLKYNDYEAKYQRQDIASAIINRPVSATWRGGFKLVESSDEDSTQLEKDWEALNKELSLISKFVRADKLSGVGSYGILLLGLSGVKNNEGFADPVKGVNNQLLYVKPLSEKTAKVSEWEKDPLSSRFGKPKFYKVTVQVGEGTTDELKVHYTRILHIPAGQLLESETNGTPRLQAVYNRLMDLEKLVGGSAEMFWRGARPGYAAKIDSEADVNDDTVDGMQTQFDEYEHNLRRVLVSEGMDLKALEMQIADPSKHVDVQLQMISAATGIPKRILTGAELGELASSQDSTNWNQVIQSRRSEYAEVVIVRPFIDMLIEYGVLNPPKTEEEGYNIEWVDLWAPSDKEKAEVGKIRAEAGAASGVPLPLEAVLTHFFGFSPEQVQLVLKQIEGNMQDEDKLKEDEEALLAEEEARKKEEAV